jgi:hypothetical protein
VNGIREGVVFAPFHYSYWDVSGSDHTRAANEVTITAWDPVSKQPIFKVAHASALAPFAQRYGDDAPDEPDRLHSELFAGTRSGGLGLLRDLHDLYLMACEADMAWTMIGQAAQGARDGDLLEVVYSCETETATQMRWLSTRMKQAAPQALVVAE